LKEQFFFALTFGYMKLNQTQKVILGIFTALPFVAFPFIIWQIFHGVAEIIAANRNGEPEFEQIMLPIISFAAPIILLSFACLVLLIFYIVHAVLNKGISAAEQLLWVLLFIFFGILAFPAYWFIRIWNNSNIS
jgi:hypothetical protein